MHTIYHIITLILILAPIGYVVGATSTAIIIRDRLRDFRSVYKQLPTFEFERIEDYAVGSKNPSLGANFTWYLYNDTFRIKKGYLPVFGKVSLLCPVELYWLYKYRRWAKKNIDVASLPLRPSIFELMDEQLNKAVSSYKLSQNGIIVDFTNQTTHHD